MKAAFKTLLGLAILMAVVVVARAEDEKPTKAAKGATTLKGELGCAKCVFKVKGVKGCKNAIKVGDDVYIFEDKGAKEPYHGKICTATAEGSVTGAVNKAKKTIKPAAGGVKFND